MGAKRGQPNSSQHERDACQGKGCVGCRVQLAIGELLGSGKEEQISTNKDGEHAR